MTGSFLIEPLGPDHDKASFSSGVAPLDRYFREQASQDMRRRASACYVALEAPKSKIAGYYTLAAAGVLLADLPESLGRKLPRYPSVPVARLGRLAVDLAYRGRKLRQRGGLIRYVVSRRRGLSRSSFIDRWIPIRTQSIPAGSTSTANSTPAREGTSGRTFFKSVCKGAWPGARS